MALKPCKECKKEVSDSAKVCPDCGVKDPTITPGDTLKGFVSIVVIGFIIYLFVGGDDNSTEKQPNEDKPKSTLAKMLDNSKPLTPEQVLSKTTEIESQLKSIPEKEYQKNLDLYEDLLSMHPDNKRYKEKVNYYQAKVFRKNKIEIQFSVWDGENRIVAHAIQKRLKDPDSYEHIETKAWDKGDYILVDTTYRAKNSFGGYVIEGAVAKVSIDGKVLELKSK